jgi:hypothetical protein
VAKIALAILFIKKEKNAKMAFFHKIKWKNTVSVFLFIKKMKKNEKNGKKCQNGIFYKIKWKNAISAVLFIKKWKKCQNGIFL